MNNTTSQPFHLYTISGMGLNELLFSRLKLNVSDIHHIKWIEPLSYHESLENYAKRMSEQILHQENVVLLGVSFGGMMAKTIAKFRKVEKIIIISSLKSAEEKPLAFEMAALMPIPIHRFTPLALKKATLPLWAPLFGLHSKVEQEFFGDMMNVTSEFYKNWATTQITNWKDNDSSQHIFHIHGDADQIFPVRHIRRARIVKGGDHAMVVKKADEVSHLINQALYDYLHHQSHSFRNQ
jgi:pimeloyl-ACP methyl ester carboxylesterase